MREWIQQAIAAVNNKTLESEENLKSRTSHIMRVNGGHVEQQHIWMKIFEYFSIKHIETLKDK